ncbi:MAG: peptidoglycan-binding protein [Bryobacterales bacterium]|nr:peptidoglycan-binding protein [Bryobacterales bacterium]
MNPGTASISGPLALGSHGQSVKTLQETLNRLLPAFHLQVDGAFGMKTDAAVRAFQQSRGLVRDGVVGPRTAAALGLRYVAMAPLPSPSPNLPSRPQLPSETPILPGVPDGNAISQLVEAVVQGLTAIHSKILGIFNALEELPDFALNEIRSLLAGPLQAAVSALREAGRLAQATPASAANILASAIRSAFQKMTAALQGVLGVIRRLPDLLGLSGIADKIQSVIVKIQRAVETVIDTILRTLSGAGNSVAQAVSAIVSVLRGVAAAI